MFWVFRKGIRIGRESSFKPTIREVPLSRIKSSVGGKCCCYKMQLSWGLNLLPLCQKAARRERIGSVVMMTHYFSSSGSPLASPAHSSPSCDSSHKKTLTNACQRIYSHSASTAFVWWLLGVFSVNWSL